MTIYLDPTKKHDFIYLFDCKNGNPNGDPDADNLPRQDLQTGKGLVSDVCLKRKIRNSVNLKTEHRIFVEEGSVLNEKLAEAVEKVGLKTEKKRLTDPKEVAQARQWMCENYWDIRIFGAVMSTGVNCGQVRGAFQITYAESFDPIFPVNHAITRCAATEGKEDKDNKTIGRKTLINYGLYCNYGFYVPAFGEQCGVSQEDLEIFWDALINMWEFDRSATRGFMAPRGLWVFTHNSKWGNAPTHKLFEHLKVKSNTEVPTSFDSYEISFDDDLPEGVTLNQLI